MPALYGITSNANVSVSNTTGLYIGSGNVTILNSAGTLLNLLSNAGTVGFYSTNSGTQVAASVDPSGVTSGTYGNVNNIPIVTVGSDGRVTQLTTANVSGQYNFYSNANVAAYLPGYGGDLGFSGGSIHGGTTNLAIGSSARFINGQGDFAIAIGSTAGTSYQGSNAIALGQYAGAAVQGQNAIAIGKFAGQGYQGANSIFIGAYAGQEFSVDNSIALIANSAVTGWNTANPGPIISNSGLYIDPVRNDTGNVAQALYYNTITKEITYTAPVSIYSNANVAAYLAANTDATIQNLNANTQQQQIQINSTSANLASFETYANVTYSTIAGAYGNANVANYLPHYGGTLLANTISSNSVSFLITGPAVQMTGTAAAVVSSGGLGTVIINGHQIFISGQGAASTADTLTVGVPQTNQSNLSIESGYYINAERIIATGNIRTTASMISDNYLFANGVNILSTVSGTYSNSNVASYLAANTDPTISNLNANTSQQAAQINTINANIGSFYTYANATYATNANLTAFETYANATYSTIANAASQESEISSLRGNITAANAAIQTLSANLGSFETYANVTFVTNANANTYSNANVASYLPVYAGNVGFGTTGTFQLSQSNTFNIAIGDRKWGQGESAIAIGYGAATVSQSGGAVAIGILAGQSTQGNNSVAIGSIAGGNTQGNNSVAIGVGAGSVSQGDYAIAIGYYAGGSNQAANSIVISGNSAVTTNALNQGFYVDPVRYDTGNVGLGIYYNTTTKEITYATAGGGGSTYSNANVASYLAANTDPTISNLNANTSQQAAQINSINANIGSFYTYANVTYSTIANAASQESEISSLRSNITAANAAIQTISANLGSFETYANVTFVTTANANTYSNTNVAAYLSGNITTGNITNTGVITSTGNITAPYHIGTAQYFSGNLAGNVLYDGLKNTANIQAAAFGNINPINSSPLSQYQQSGQGGVGVANGAALSPAPAVYTYFSGNGVTAITTAGIASMISQANVTVRTSTTAPQNIVGQSFQTQAYALGAGNMSSNDRIKGQIAAIELWPQGATWGSNQFSAHTGTDFVPYTSSSVAVAIQSQMSLTGNGNVSAAAAQVVLGYVAPTVGAMNVNYLTGLSASIGYGSYANVSGIGISTINVARGVLVTGSYGNAATPTNQVINNLYGVHLPTNWENNGTAGKTITYLKRSLQSEDVNTDLYNAGNVIIGGNLITTSTTAPITFNSPTTYNSNVTVAGSNSLLKVTTFTVTALNAITGSTGQFAAVSNGTGKSGGQMAYWDTTNSRWSWFDTNLAVS